jgi:putative transposase
VALGQLAIELDERGLSTRDIEDAFTDETGRRLLSRAAVSEITERLWTEDEAFSRRDLSEHGIVYLFVDGIAERLRPDQSREAVLAAWGIGEDGRKVLLALMAGSKEDTETMRAFFQDMRARGLGDPVLVISDGAPGLIRALEECFPRSARQRCLAHRMRNLAVKVPTDPTSVPTTPPACRARSPASRRTSKPASRICGCRSRTAGRSARQTFLNDCSSRSAGG